MIEMTNTESIDLLGIGSCFEKLTLSEEDAASPKWNYIGKKDLEYTLSSQEKSVQPSTSQDNLSRLSTKSELRNYQKELAEPALAGRNTLICAPTGSGKTKVAIHIIIEHLKNNEGTAKKVAFLARTVPLLTQQHKMLCQELPDNYKITSICGRNKSSIKLHLLVPEYDVIAMTPMILCNSLKENLIENLGVFSLIVFDECHHTHKAEPYNLLMLSYLKWKKRRDANIKLPQIVGLTASVGVDRALKIEDAKKSIKELCGNLDVEKISIVEKYKEELEQYTPFLKEETKQLKEQNQTEIAKKISTIMIKMEQNLKDQVKGMTNQELKLLVTKIPENKRYSMEYRQWVDSVKREARAEIVDSTTDLNVRTVIIIANYLIVYNSALDTLALVDLRDAMGYLKASVDTFFADEKSIREELCFYNYFQELGEFVSRGSLDENRNLSILRETLCKYLTDKSHRGIIFVKTRLLTEALSVWLNRQEMDWAASPFTSANNATGIGMSQQQQHSILEAFRNGEKRILVATSIAEEGLDIPECNLVLKYNHVGNEITKVQTQGRARAKGGVSVLLAMDDIFKKEILNGQRVKLMREAINSLREINELEWTKFIHDHQEKSLKEAKEQSAKEIKRTHGDFTMICHLCRKFKVQSSKIRLINKTCLAALDSSLLQQIWLFPSPKGTEEFDEIEYVADVRCYCEPQPGKKCRAFLGRLVRRCNNPVIALKVKSFDFVSSSNPRPQTFNQLKKVPFFVQDITNEDIQRYIDEKLTQEEETNVEMRTNEVCGSDQRPNSHKRDHSLEARETDKRQKIAENVESDMEDKNKNNSVDDVINDIDDILSN